MKKLFIVIIIISFSIPLFGYRIVYGKNVVINEPVHEDLYIAGGSITINAAVFGDLIVGGGTVIINDTITNDILLVGGDITFNGYVGDDIRCAGGRITISKNVTGDVVAAGGEVHINKGVVVGGLISAGGNLIIDGDVIGDVRCGSGSLVLNGNVTKDIDCRGGKITINGNIGGKSILAARDIYLGNKASFNGDVRYWNNVATLNFGQTIKNGKAIYDSTLQVKTGSWNDFGVAAALGMFWYLGMALVMILIMQYLFSATIKKAASQFYNNALRSLGIGLLYFFTVPIAAIVAMVTIIGLPVGILLLIGYLTLFLLISVIVSVVLANWFNHSNNYDWSYWKLSFVAFGIFVLLKVVTMIPIIGWIMITVLACISFGAILSSIKWKRRHSETYLTGP